MICELQVEFQDQQDQYPTSNYEEQMKRSMLTKTKLTRINRSPFQEMGQKWQNMQQIARKKKNYYGHNLYRWGIKKVSIFSLSKECHIGIFLFH